MKANPAYQSELESQLRKQGLFILYDDEQIPVIEVGSFPELGRLVALRFIEWVQLNPEGVVSLPTGKTPEYFIRWMNHILENWDKAEVKQLVGKYSIPHQRPTLSQLHFVQIDDFFPIPPDHPNSFAAYVKRHYLRPFGFGLDRALLMDFERIKWPNNLTVADIFPDQFIDLSLRTRTPESEGEYIQREAIFTLDTFAQEYEQRIRDLGGIGFFLGGIGPDGHIAFNVRGSDFFSTTRLTYTNFETQAASATDLGGIEISAKKAVMTIGLGTITYNPDVVAIIMAAGEAKASILSEAITQPAVITNPCSVLQQVKSARVYLTSGAAVKLCQRRLAKFEEDRGYTDNDVVRSIIDISLNYETPIANLSKKQISQDLLCTAIMEARNWKTGDIKEAARQQVLSRLAKGAEYLHDKRFLHTGPHHDDILLGYLPSIIHQIRSGSNQHQFAVMTSGFTSVPGSYIQQVVQQALEYLDHWDFKRKWDSGFFTQSDRLLRIKDTFSFLSGLVSHNEDLQRRCVSRRVIRAMMDIYGREDSGGLSESLRYILKDIQQRYPGQKDPKDIQQLKGMMREFEEDLAWAHFGIEPDYVHHLRLAFYKGDYFTEEPTEVEDLPPIGELFTHVKPDILTLAFDPEASGPDTHYKVLQAITAHLTKLAPDEQEHLEIWGYRNVWHRFHPGDANMYVPVSINSLGILDHIFKSCYLTQKDASFPSHEHAGPFSELVQRIFVEQFNMLRTALGPEFWYQSESPRLRATQGILFMRSMSFEELKSSARALRSSIGQV
jgi:glucosamine-6-phosphate deaminase